MTLSLIVHFHKIPTIFFFFFFLGFSSFLYVQVTIQGEVKWPKKKQRHLSKLADNTELTKIKRMGSQKSLNIRTMTKLQHSAALIPEQSFPQYTIYKKFIGVESICRLLLQLSVNSSGSVFKIGISLARCHQNTGITWS